MKILTKKNLIVSSIVLPLSVMSTSCGDDSEEESTVSSFLSTIDFSIPSTLAITSTSLALQDGSSENSDSSQRGPARTSPRGETRPTAKQSAPVSQSSDIINIRADQMSKVIDRLNEVMTRLQNDSVAGEGTFSGKGPDGLISGQVVALTDDADYTYHAALCYDSVQFMYLKFNDDGTKIHAIRDFAASPMGRTDSVDMLSSVTFSKDTATNESQLELLAYGSPWNKSSDDSTSYMVEYSLGKVDADGAFWLKSVMDNFDDEPASFTGDAYLVGTVAADQSGYYIGYHGSKDACSSVTFDDSATSPEFCVGKAVGSDTSYTADEISTAWTNLSSFGLAASTSLQTISMSSALACE